MKKTLLCLILAAAAASAQPKVNSILNNYSYTLPGVPNYGIAPGSLFHIFGTGVGPSQTPTLPDLSKSALTTNLNGVVVNVTVGGTTVQAPLYYVSATDIAGILPSNTPVGTGTVTVTYSGQTSATSPITVVPAAFGMLTLTGNGAGTAAVFDANNGSNYVTPTASANPGDTLILWGSGLGASPGDETKYPFTQTDLKNTANVKVYIGGQAATVAYAGRSQFPGLDQINVVVPSGVSGCGVAIVVQTGTGASTYVSNTATTSVAPSGRLCSDPATSGLSTSDIQALLAKGNIKFGYLNIDKTTTSSPGITVGGITVGGSTSTSDSASGAFFNYTAQQYTAGTASITTNSIGSCTTYQIQGQSGSRPTVVLPTYLDAGNLSVKLPSGSSMDLKKTTTNGIISYSVDGSNATGSQSPLFIPAAGGAFSFTNTGGPDVGVFTGAQITMPPAIVWTNMDSITTVVRSQGVTVNWSTANPYNGYVTIAGSSYSLNSSNPNASIYTGFTCTAPYSAGTFTVQPYVLLSLVAGSGSVGGVAIPTGSLSLSLNATPVKFNAPNIDYATLGASSGTGKSVSYQ